MSTDGGYPMGAFEDKNAPFKEELQDDIFVEVTVSVTMSKQFLVPVNDYKCIPIKEGGGYNFTDCNFKESVEHNIILPQDVSGILKSPHLTAGRLNKIIDDLSNWNVDEMEVIYDK